MRSTTTPVSRCRSSGLRSGSLAQRWHSICAHKTWWPFASRCRCQCTLHYNFHTFTAFQCDRGHNWQYLRLRSWANACQVCIGVRVAQSCAFGDSWACLRIPRCAAMRKLRANSKLRGHDLPNFTRTFCSALYAGVAAPRAARYAESFTGCEYVVSKCMRRWTGLR